jgi:hypothetical protein
MKTASKIREEIQAHEAKVKELKKKERALLRRHLAEEQRQRDKNNQLLGFAVAKLLSATTLTKFRGHICSKKSEFVRQVKGQDDETEYEKLLAYIDAIIFQKEADQVPEAKTLSGETNSQLPLK